MYSSQIKISILLGTAAAACAFMPASTSPGTTSRVGRERISISLNAEEKTEETKGGPLAGFFDMFSNLDAVADDFFYKRMGKGEIFYGKRKYKPSGDVEGDYNGFGLSDKLKIDMTREYKEQWLEEKRMRDEIKMLKEEKEKRNSSY